MKKIYFVLFSLFCVLGIAQSSRMAENYGIEVPGTAIAVGNKIYYTAKILRISGCCNDSVYVIGRTLSGTEVLRKFIYEAPRLDNFDILKTADDKLLVRIRSGFASCDEIDDNTQLVQLDTLGNIDFSFNDYRKVDGIVATSGGGFLRFSNNYLQKYNAQGQRTFTTLTTLGTLSSAFEYSPTVYVGAFQTGSGPKLRFFDAQFSAVSEVSTSVLLTNLQPSDDGGIIGYAGATIYKYNQLLNLQHQYGVGSATISAFCTKNDSVYVAAYGANGVPTYKRLDSNFVLTHTGQSNLEKSSITSILKSKDNQLYALISTNKNYTSFTLAGGGINHNNHLGLYKTAVNGDLNSSLDIGVSSISILSQQVGIPFDWPKGMVAVARVGVRNYSIDTVKSFNLNAFLGSGGISYCLFGLNQNFQATIPPGDSITVITNTFVSYISTQATPATYTVCVFTSIPGGQIDMDATNDELCKPIANVYYSLSEFDKEKLFSIYPSPVKHMLQVHSNTNIHSIELYNQLGEIIFKSLQTEDVQQQIDFTGYAPGIYFISIGTNEKHYYQKVIKEN